MSLGFRLKKVQIIAGLLVLPLLIVGPRLYRFDVQGVSANFVSQSYKLPNLVETLTQEDLAMAPALSILEYQKRAGNVETYWGKSYLNALLKDYFLISLENCLLYYWLIILI